MKLLATYIIVIKTMSFDITTIVSGDKAITTGYIDYPDDEFDKDKVIEA